jgi:hypothetical protein
MLDKAMVDAIMQARLELAGVAKDNNEKAIQDKIDNLEAVSAKFVEMRMNSSIAQAMKGHNVNEFSN